MKSVVGVRLLGLIACVGCGDVSSAGAPGDPLYSVPGRLVSGAFDEPDGTYRSVLGWVSFGGGAYVECLEAAGPLDCRPAPANYESTLVIESAHLIPRFPHRFTLDIVSLPRQNTLAYKGSVLAIGGVAIFDDRNQNAVLDLTPDEAGVADRLVAESAISDTRSAIVYREGPVHPMWKVLRAFGCADPPVGFSMVVHPTSFRCTVEPLAELVVSPLTDETTARVICALQNGALQSGALDGQSTNLPTLDLVLHPLAAVTCHPSGESLTYFVDRGNACDSVFQTTLALKGCPPDAQGNAECWDLTESPPDWWPCALD